MFDFVCTTCTINIDSILIDQFKLVMRLHVCILICYSACSGFISAVLGTPADVVKTRIMNQPIKHGRSASCNSHYKDKLKAVIINIVTTHCINVGLEDYFDLRSIL